MQVLLRCFGEKSGAAFLPSTPAFSGNLSYNVDAGAYNDMIYRKGEVVGVNLVFFVFVFVMVAGFLALAAVLLYDMSLSIKASRKIKKLNRMLEQEGDLSRYIREYAHFDKKMLQELHGLSTCISFNLAAGYRFNGQIDKAIKVLEAIPLGKTGMDNMLEALFIHTQLCSDYLKLGLRSKAEQHVEALEACGPVIRSSDASRRSRKKKLQRLSRCLAYCRSLLEVCEEVSEQAGGAGVERAANEAPAVWVSPGELIGLDGRGSSHGFRLRGSFLHVAAYGNWLEAYAAKSEPEEPEDGSLQHFLARDVIPTSNDSYDMPHHM